MSDGELKMFALTKVHTIFKQNADLLKEELANRGLRPGFAEAVDAQLNDITRDQLRSLAQIVKDAKCPDCGTMSQPLRGGMIRKVISFIVMTQSETRPYIACAECLNKKRSSAILNTSLLGWWGFPWGLIKTPTAIARHFGENGERDQVSNTVLAEFTIRNIGYLTGMRDKRDFISKFIMEENHRLPEG